MRRRNRTSMGGVIPEEGVLNREVRCIHLAEPVPQGTRVSSVRLVREQGDTIVCQGWARRPRYRDGNPSDTELYIVCFNLADLDIVPPSPQ